MTQNIGQPDDPLEVLLPRVQAQDESVIPGLRDCLLRSCRRLRGGLTDDAIDEIVSEAVYHVWSRIATYDPKRGSFAGWCNAVVRNVARSRVRRAGHMVPLSFEVPAEELPAYDEESDQPDSTRAAVLRDLWEMFEALSGQDQQIIRAYLMGPARSWAVELSRESGLSPETIRVRRFRIMQQMKAKCLRRHSTLLLEGIRNDVAN